MEFIVCVLALQTGCIVKQGSIQEKLETKMKVGTHNADIKSSVFTEEKGK